MTETLKSTPVVEQIDLGPLEEFPVGRFKVVDVDGRAIGVLRGEADVLFAILDHCPHRAAPVCRVTSGPLAGDVRAHRCYVLS